MKLLTKINLQYLVFSSILFLLTGVAISYTLNYIVSEEMDEKLRKMAEKVVMAINENARVPEIPLYIEAIEIPYQDEVSYYSDTVIVDVQDEENEIFRQFTSIRTLKDKTYKIIVRESQIESDELYETIAQIIGAIFLILIISLIVVNNRIAIRIWRPFKSNLLRIREFSLNDLSPIELQKTSIEEFQQLNTVITALTERVILDFKSVKQFSEDASHEFQTPLSIISTKLENLMSDSQLSQELLEQLKVIYSSALRLSRLNRNLLLLTKIENKQFKDAKALSLQELVRNKLEEFVELIELNRLCVTTQILNDTMVTMSPTLADIMLNNLISNAVNHTPAGGTIDVKIQDRELAISNDGDHGIAEPDKIFDRFYKENKSSKSVGLGLAIVKKICDSQSITIKYSFSNRKHQFTFIF